jgi:hypothetical protein
VPRLKRSILDTYFFQAAVLNFAKVALYLHDIFVVDDAHAAATVFDAKESKEHCICEHLYTSISDLSPSRGRGEDGRVRENSHMREKCK